MKINVWNINQRGNGKDVPWIMTAITKNSPDLVILTEYTQEVIVGEAINNDYHVLTSTPTVKGANEILIAVKKQFEPNEPTCIDTLSIITDGEEIKPNCLQINLPYKNLSIIGYRTIVDNKWYKYGGPKQYYANKINQVKVLAEHAKTIEGNVVIGGDFNLNTKFRLGDRETIKEDFERIIDDMNAGIDSGWRLYTPQTGFSVISDKAKGGCLDHIITKNISLDSNKIEYSWEFIEENPDEYFQLNPPIMFPIDNPIQQNIPSPLPDHAILKATFEI
jgi:hypothetical protein